MSGHCCHVCLLVPAVVLICWTLPSILALCVHPELMYVQVRWMKLLQVAALHVVFVSSFLAFL
jgi:hypothetical protein